MSMSQLHYITSSHKKGKHLSFKERIIVQLRIKDNYSIRAIAREIGCLPTTVSNEIKRGTIPMYKNCSPHYRAKAGQAVYDAWLWMPAAAELSQRVNSTETKWSV